MAHGLRGAATDGETAHAPIGARAVAAGARAVGDSRARTHLSRVPRLLSSLLITLLGLWPVRAATTSDAPRARRGRRLPSRLGANDDQDPVEAPERARTLAGHTWPGEVIVHAGAERTVTSGHWRLTLDRAQRAHRGPTARSLALDPAQREVWETELEALLTLQLPGARLAVTQADADGWRELELRAPTHPETVVQLDRAAVAGVFGAEPGTVRVELRVRA